MNTRAFAGILVLGFVAACGGASSVEFFDSPSGSSSALKDASPPIATTPTASTTTDPPPPPDEPDAAPPPSECSDKKPGCPTGLVCEVPGCSGVGKCVPESTYGTDPVCGCDKLTYASATLVKNVAARGSGECTKDFATPCSGTCSNGAKCNLRVGSALMCGDNAGTCWKMPQTCPTMPKSFRLCGQVTCSSACDAILQNRKYHPDALCP